jgi:hypothetical protein
LGFDSCAIFYIGGSVQVQLHWNLSHLNILAAVADDLDDDTIKQSQTIWMSDRDNYGLHKYGGSGQDNAVPGQPWHCYRSIRYDEKDHEKNLDARLTELLSLSTTQEELDQIPRRPGKQYCPYLRFRQKPLNVLEWLVDGNVHNGAHFPLCVFTHNASHRSKESHERRCARHMKSQERNGKPQNSRSRGAEDSCSRGAGASVWNTHNQEHPPYGAYVAQCVPEAYGSQRRSWEENSWNRGDGRNIHHDWCAEPKW